MKHVVDGVAYYNWWSWNHPQRIDKGTGKLGNKRPYRPQHY